MHQPSPLWPPPSADFAEKSRTRLKTDKKGDVIRTPTPTTSKSRSRKQSQRSKRSSVSGTWAEETDGAATDQPSEPTATAEQVEENGDANGSAPEASDGQTTKPWKNPYIPIPYGDKMSLKDGPQSDTGLEPAQILQIEVKGKRVDIAEQIQLYATNEQVSDRPLGRTLWLTNLASLAHASALLARVGRKPRRSAQALHRASLSSRRRPLSQFLQIAGDKEVLRDEIIYVAHRAAHPDRYPLREGLLNANPDRAEKANAYPPTEVHLQVYGALLVLGRRLQTDFLTSDQTACATSYPSSVLRLPLGTATEPSRRFASTSRLSTPASLRRSRPTAWHSLTPPRRCKAPHP